MDLQVLGLQTDMTRVFSFYMSRDSSARVFPESGSETPFHPASHHGNKQEAILDFAKINTYHVSMIPYLLGRLKETQEGDTHLLDKTMVLYGSAMGDPNVHNHKRVPFLVMGGANGKHKGGLHLWAPDETPAANVFLSLAHKLGMEDVESFGDSTGEFAISDPVGRGVSAMTNRIGGLRRRFAAVGTLAAALVFLAATAPDAPMADAAMRGDVAAVRALIAQGADVNAAQGDGMTALHWAADLGNVELAQVLIAAGANVQATTRLGAFTPLHIAGENGDAALVKVLLAAGANPRAASDLGGETPMHFAAQSGSVEAVVAMLDRGGDVNAKSTTGQTPLMFAAEANRPEAVKALIERGGDPALTTAVIDLVEQEKHARAAEKARDEIWAKYREASPDPVSWVPTSDQVQEAMEAARKLEAMGPEVHRVEDWEAFQVETRRGSRTGSRPATRAG
jgi:predicted LPLAT superfamily acyltransferase